MAAALPSGDFSDSESECEWEIVSINQTSEQQLIKKEQKYKFGICVKTCDCQYSQKRPNNALHRVHKGDLVEILEYDKGYVMLLLLKCKLETSKLSNFNWIEPQLYKYLNAIKDNDERLKFYNNNTRREFVLTLKKNTKVTVAVSKNDRIKAEFLDNDEKDNKMFLTVVLSEKPPFFAIKILKENCHSCTIRELKYSCPANMIRKSIIRPGGEGKWPCSGCYTDNERDQQSCRRCKQVRSDAGSFNPTSLFEYKMNNKYRGIVVIFNNVQFDDNRYRDQTRYGTEKDVEALHECIPLLGFAKDHIIVETNLKQNQILEYWRTLLNRQGNILKNSDCLAIFILSHGSKSNRIQASDTDYDLYDFVEKFTSKDFQQLIDKPKLFFIQACRGTKNDSGLFADGIEQNRTLPSNTDILISHSSFHNHESYRHTEFGSWYIQDLCQTIRMYSRQGRLETTDITELLTYTNYLTNYRIADGDFHGKRQVPSFNSSLSRKLYFKKKSSSGDKTIQLYSPLKFFGNNDE